MFRVLVDEAHQVSIQSIKIFSTVILALPLIQDGQLSVSDGGMCTSAD